jgi:hypothetical protein
VYRPGKFGLILDKSFTNFFATMIFKHGFFVQAIMMAEEMCQGKQSCSIDTGVNVLAPGAQDPCPGVRYSYSGPLFWSQVLILRFPVLESGIDTQDPCPGVRY